MGPERSSDLSKISELSSELKFEFSNSDIKLPTIIPVVTN
jgi:hypothetical protein